MPKDDLDKLGLDDDEVELIKARRKQRREEDERVIRIKDGEKEAELPYSVGRNWLRKHGFDLDDEAAAPEPEPEPEPEEEPKDAPKRFAGRRVS
ncbi:MAG TPA: hypothetical protein VEH31_17535 [Streptosporangiaceae bacterium]|nr:hypothetical protein [Streptosporangiaceae bacterium]